MVIISWSCNQNLNATNPPTTFGVMNFLQKDFSGSPGTINIKS